MSLYRKGPRGPTTFFKGSKLTKRHKAPSNRPPPAHGGMDPLGAHLLVAGLVGLGALLPGVADPNVRADVEAVPLRLLVGELPADEAHGAEAMMLHR